MKKMKEKEEDGRKEKRKKKMVRCGYTQSGEETRNSISKSTQHIFLHRENETESNVQERRSRMEEIGCWRMEKEREKMKEEKKKEERRKKFHVIRLNVIYKRM